jgi:hypothetical protein
MDVDGEAACGAAENSYRANAAQESDRCVVLSCAVSCFVMFCYVFPCFARSCCFFAVLCWALLGFAGLCYDFCYGLCCVCYAMIQSHYLCEKHS